MWIQLLLAVLLRHKAEESLPLLFINERPLTSWLNDCIPIFGIAFTFVRPTVERLRLDIVVITNLSDGLP